MRASPPLTEDTCCSTKPPTCASLGEVFPGKEGSHQGSNLREQEVVLWFGRSCVLIDAAPNQ